MDRETAWKRSRLIRGIRDFFTDRNYLETDTPLLSAALIPESAIEVFATKFESPYRGAKPLFLVPSPELWMKRLIAAGFGSLFQISKAFRNAESIGQNHNPEFTMLEYYTLDADYIRSIEVTEDLFAKLLSIDTGHRRPQGDKSLSPPFLRMTMAEAFREFAGFDLGPCSAEDLVEKSLSLNIRADRSDTWEIAFNRIFVDRVEPELPRDKPLVLLDYPAEVRCLAKKIPGTPWRERWELYVDGVETANCFSEETSPAEVAEYFLMEKTLKSSALVPHAVDEAFCELYRQGFPPCSGVALGVDRLLMSFLGFDRIEDVLFFPLSDILGAENKSGGAG